MAKKVSVWDILLIVTLVAVCFAAWIIPRNPGNTLTVTVDGSVVCTLDLSKNQQLDLSDGTRIVIEDGFAWVDCSTCPDHLCEKTGKISQAGDVILCVPNRISLQISQEEVDAFVG